MRLVSDSESIRRDNRGLVLGALRARGPLSRTQLTGATGLSSASVTAITQDMLAQGVLVDLPVEGRADLRLRGRPAINVGFSRTVASLCLIEIDVSRVRLSLVDYGGTLIDRIETMLEPAFFAARNPSEYLTERVAALGKRNAAEFAVLHRISISVQGILDRDALGLKWSPVVGLGGQPFVTALADHFRVPVALSKRGLLLAEGTRLLFPELHQADVATVFVGATVAMGMSMHGRSDRRSEDAATEFGHMVHIPHGALCRCGTRGCIEAYAADYGVLRTAYGVPDKTPPAPAVPPAQFVRLVESARNGDHNAIRAFNLAGSAIGFGLNRLMTVFDPSHVVIVGPGALAYPLMKDELEAAVAASLVGRVHGVPKILTHDDESEPIFRGLCAKALAEIDKTVFAPLPSSGQRTETA